LQFEFRDPSNKYDFEDICYESDDPDFQHEYQDLNLVNSADKQDADYGMEFSG